MQIFFTFIFNITNRLTRTKKGLILLESNPSYGDNTYPVYQYIKKLKNSDDYDLIWLIFDDNSKKELSDKEFKLNYKSKYTLFISWLRLIRLYSKAEYSIFHIEII